MTSQHDDLVPEETESDASFPQSTRPAVCLNERPVEALPLELAAHVRVLHPSRPALTYDRVE